MSKSYIQSYQYQFNNLVIYINRLVRTHLYNLKGINNGIKRYTRE